jgi:adhesin/invasin
MNRNRWKALAAVCLAGLTSCTTGFHAIPTSTAPLEAVAATSGANQSHAIGGMFGTALVATVTTNGAPNSGVVVTFTAPSNGPSATFSNTSSTSATATTDVNGIATSPSFTANNQVGRYNITATVDGNRTPATFALSNTTGGPAAMMVASGSPQSAPINGAFSAPLVAKVVDIGGNPVSGALVTFTAPASGASGLFTNGTATETDTSDANGLATSTTFTANGISGADIVTATAAGVASGTNFNLTNAAGAPTSIVVASGAPQSAAINTVFSVPLAASVLDASSNPVSGVAVTFTAPTSGATGTFAGGASTAVATTNSSGIATAPAFTANGTTGSYSVIASAPGISTTANFALTNRIAGSSYVFYLSGQDAFGPDFYALAGSVLIDPNGNVLGGEQDYNDGGYGLASPEPSGDTITGGTLSVDGATGQGTLQLITNNTSLGVNGVETLGVQFVNTNHAQIIQFDGTATSTGSMDLQNPPGALNGGFAFTLTGLDNFQGPVSFGGVFSVTGATLRSGTVDENDNGTLNTAVALTGTISTPDSYGRGTLTTNLNYQGTPIALDYYVVGPEVIRIVGVDATDTVLGSAYGQGTSSGNFSNASLVTSIFGIQGSPDQVNYATAGIIVPSSGTFSGVADDSELFQYDIQSTATAISGVYSVSQNGYASLTIALGTLGDVSSLGVYMVDPYLNLNDPNNKTGALGGALIADMDSALPGGVGVLIPQTDTSTASFNGNYAFGAQGVDNFLEFDFVGQGSVTGGALTGTGLLSDTFESFGTSTTDSAVVFSGTPLADTGNPGRYTMLSGNPTPNPLTMSVNGSAPSFDTVVYQASGNQLIWINEDPAFETVFLGTLQQQGSLSGIPGTGNSGTPTITATSGTSQSAAVNTAFAAPLVATVTTNGTGTSGVVVTFTAPTSGASGTFAGGSNTATATTNARGVATSPTFTANAATGAYSVTATVPNSSIPATFSLTNTSGVVVVITATGGTPQSATVNTPFASPLVATVTTNGSPTSGASVTFNAPSSGASGTFAGGNNSATATTDSKGVATSPTFTANGTTGSYTVTATVAGTSTPANFSLTNSAVAVETITATSGTPQSATINTAFAAPLVATVTTGGNPDSGVSVTFTAPASGASGTFAGGTNAVTATTDVDGVATSPTFTANGTTGGYAVTATASGATGTANFSLTNNSSSNTPRTYVFYLSGQETFGPDFYALAGAVTIDSTGNVVGGEQDYNDGGYGFASPEPSGDSITGGTLTVNSTSGQGTLTLTTNNSTLGVNGVETLAVQFVNSNHAIITQFDGVATSSGSMDLQTLPSSLSAGFAFTMNGVDNTYNPAGFGGVFSIAGTTLSNGVVDMNDAGAVTTGTALTGTVSAFDSFGRGTINSTLNFNGSSITVNYYVVGPEALRLIGVDTTDSAIGSAFGQGSNATSGSNAQLGKSVFALNGSPYPANFGAVGMFSTSNTSSVTADFSGIADDNELVGAQQLAATSISGTYSITSNGYGSFTINLGELGDVSSIGIYLTDPNLNLLDPNNTASGGGALLADMDSLLAGGTGLVVPQTDTSKTNFKGPFAFNAQGFYNSFFEFDFVSTGSVTSGTLSGTGLLSDPFLNLGTNATDSGVTFAGAPLPDTSNPGRYTLFSTNPTPNPFKITVGKTITSLDVVLYQANGGELFWLDEDSTDVFQGSMQQLGSLSAMPAKKKILRNQP